MTQGFQVSGRSGLSLAGRTALATGASDGLGAAIARQRTAHGADLVLHGRNEQRLTAAAQDIARAAPDRLVHAITLDLAANGAGATLMKDVKALGLSIDVLVNNAGFAAHGSFAELDGARMAEMIRVNRDAVLDLTRLLLPDMLRRRHGVVLNIASTAGFQPTPTMAVYGPTNAFVLALFEALWVETRGSGVRVAAFCPGPTATGFFDAAASGVPFLTRGRADVETVARRVVAQATAHGAPSVVPGAGNRAVATIYR